MIYTDFKGKKLSMLGFGLMRLPTKEDGTIDEDRFAEMTDHAIRSGVNYFDTAYPYHDGYSELVAGKVLKKYPRDSIYLATKYPGHQISKNYDPKTVFEDQLKKCGVDYFDFYLLHNVCESSLDVYLNEKWGILDYFKEQKRLGRIKHLGFSTHARLDTLKTFLDKAGEDMEFCQIQLNWLDWTLQDAKGKVKLLSEYDIPVWVMEPVRGGRLCKLDETSEKRLKEMRPDESIPAWGFRFIQDIPGVTMVLSGMSNLDQMKDNIKTFSVKKPLSENERNTLFDIAQKMMKLVPCTFCKYCMPECPKGLDIPMLMATYNELLFSDSVNTAMRVELLDDDKKPSACIGCGRCMRMCPQGINIPDIMQKLSKRLEEIPKWKDICKAREEAADKLKK